VLYCVMSVGKLQALKKLAPTPPTETTLNLVDMTRAALTSKAGQL
jgi:hypothetical protein